MINFFNVFSQNEKSLNYQNYKKIQNPVDCYNEGCQFLTIYHYLNIDKKEFDHFQTRDSIDKISCILNSKAYAINICIKIFEKLNLKILETQNIKPKYIRINNNGTLSLTDTTETTLLCTCGIQHNNLIEEKKFYISSIKTTMLSFIKNIKILIDEIPLEQKEMIGQINCTNEYKKLQNFETNTLYETIFLTKIKFKLETMPTCNKSQKIDLMKSLNLITKIEQIFPQKTYSNLNKRSINLLNLLGLSTANQLQTIYDNENKVHTFNKILVSNEKILNNNLQNLNQYVRQENNFIHELHSENKKLDEKINILKQESLNTKLNFFSHLHLFQSKFTFVLNYIQFNEYKNQIMNILKSAFDENAELIIAAETIFIKIPEQKFQHITKIKFQCVPTSNGKIFRLKSLKHKNGTILATEFHGKKSDISNLQDIFECSQYSCPDLFMTLPFDFFSIVKINKTISIVTSGDSNICLIKHQEKKYQKINIKKGQTLLKTEKGTILRCRGQTIKFETEIKQTPEFNLINETFQTEKPPTDLRKNIKEILLELNMTNQKNLSQTEDFTINDPEITQTETLYIIIITLTIVGFGVNFTYCIYKKCKSNEKNKQIKIEFDNKNQNTSLAATNTENTQTITQEQQTTNTTNVPSVDNSFVRYDLSGEEIIISLQ